jgi:hypothetical protein
MSARGPSVSTPCMAAFWSTSDQLTDDIAAPSSNGTARSAPDSLFSTASNAEALDALAAEAETGYDLSRGTRKYVGRPSLNAGISPRVSFRMTQGLYDAARARAEREGRSVSEIAREAMERYIRE